jgi:hypothetical protein
MYDAVQGPTPGSASSVAIAPWPSRESKVRRPSATARASVIRVLARASGIPSAATRASPAAATTSGVGNSVPPPSAATSRPASVVAARTETCCPSTARAAVSNGS